MPSRRERLDWVRRHLTALHEAIQVHRELAERIALRPGEHAQFNADTQVALDEDALLLCEQLEALCSELDALLSGEDAEPAR